MSMPELLQALYEQGASDLHLKVGRPPMMRRRGDLTSAEYETAKTATLAEAADDR